MTAMTLNDTQGTAAKEIHDGARIDHRHRSWATVFAMEAALSFGPDPDAHPPALLFALYIPCTLQSAMVPSAASEKLRRPPDARHPSPLGAHWTLAPRLVHRNLPVLTVSYQITRSPYGVVGGTV
ncbi:hypothetical protein AUP68_01698 [Ilyonectria robusta]